VGSLITKQVGACR